METIESAAEKLGGLRLPTGLEPIEVAGEGSCSITFRANYRGDIVAMKVYRPESIERFKKKHNVNIAVYEMSRNRKFRKIPELLPYTAKPIAVMGHDGKSTLLFLQEFIDGVTVKELAERNKGLPASVLEAGETIVRVAEMNELHDLGLSIESAMVRKQSASWSPVLYDFNQRPQDAKPSGGFLSKVLGGGNKLSKNDYRAIAEWRAYSEQCSKP